MGDAHYGLPVERARRHRQFQKRQVFDPFDPFDEFSSLLGLTSSKPKTSTPTLSPTTAKTSPTTSKSSTSLTTSKSSTSTSVTPTPTPTLTPKPVQSVSIGTLPTQTPKVPIPTGNSNASTTGTDNTAGGVSPGVLGAIGAIAGVVVLVIAFLIVRKVRIAKRRDARATWNPPIIEPLEKPSDPSPAPIPPASYNQFMPGQGSINKPLPSGPAYPAPAVGYNTQPTYGGYAQPPYQPPTGYAQQPQSNIFAATAYAPTDLAGPVPLARTTPPPPSSYISIVKRTFIPSLPDELSISTGESVRVLASYDDGWGLCEKVSNPGEKGVVPLECLGEAAGANTSSNNLQPTAPIRDSARLSRRASSLNPAQPGHY